MTASRGGLRRTACLAALVAGALGSVVVTPVEADEVREILARDRAVSVAPAFGEFAAGEVGRETMGIPADFLGGRRHISPARAFVYSALVPGLGELAQGSKSGLAFLAADAVSWTGMVIYNRRGHDGEDTYRRYVDANYSRDQYQGVVDKIYREFEGGYCQTAGSDTAFSCEDLAAYLGLDLDTHSGHYYEDVGKLDKYIFGWRDWADTTGDGASDYDPATTPEQFGNPWLPGAQWPGGFPPFNSGLRAQYQDLRRSANRNFARADKFSWVLVLNRVVSGFHAAWMARGAASRGEEAMKEPETRLVIDPVTAGGAVRVALARRF